jgi:hypothetical protein
LRSPEQHDLALLLRMIEATLPTLPDSPKDAPTLTLWAVAMRYDEMDSSLEREPALSLAVAAVGWARRLVDAARRELPDLDEGTSPPANSVLR